MISTESTRFTLSCLVAVAVMCFLLVPAAQARPQHSSLEKRVSDQRLAELETLLALAMNSRLNDMPVGYGLIDPHAIGRRKRSAHPLSDALIRELAANPASYNRFLHLPASLLQQEEQEESLQMAAAKMAGSGNQRFGEANPALI